MALFTGGGFNLTLWSLPGLTTLTLHLDPLSAVFVLVTGLVLFPASIYAAGELRRESLRGHERAFTVMLLALYASIVLILIAGDAVLFLLAWEVMSILCYLLVRERPRRRERPAGRIGLSAARDGRGGHARGRARIFAAGGQRELAGVRRAQVRGVPA